MTYSDPVTGIVELPSMSYRSDVTWVDISAWEKQQDIIASIPAEELVDVDEIVFI